LIYFEFAGKASSRNNDFMRRRVLLWLSLGINIALAAVLLCLPPAQTKKPEASPPMPPTVDASKVYKTNVVVRRQNFTWDEIESADYATYIANLRAIACPEATIRDIILADVNQLFARRRATEIVTAEQQWWRSEPDPDVTQAASDKLKALEAERRTLLTALLGPEWESSYYPYPAHPDSPPLDGPILGSLSPQTKQAIRDIESRATERRQAYLEAMQKEGKQPDPAELARLRQQTRAELAQTLDSEQLEEYLLRYSGHANTLRTELHGLFTTPEQFRALFRQMDSIDQQLQILSNATDAAGAARRRELEQQRIHALQETLGNDGYKQYRLLQDPVYRDVQAAAQQAGAPAEKLPALYEINRATDQEQQRIRNDSTMTTDQKEQALEAVQTAQQNSWRKVLGEELYNRYVEQSAKP
jgi:hypothetical protein